MDKFSVRTISRLKRDKYHRVTFRNRAKSADISKSYSSNFLEEASEFFRIFERKEIFIRNFHTWQACKTSKYVRA